MIGNLFSISRCIQLRQAPLVFGGGVPSVRHFSHSHTFWFVLSERMSYSIEMPLNILLGSIGLRLIYCMLFLLVGCDPKVEVVESEEIQFVSKAQQEDLVVRSLELAFSNLSQLIRHREDGGEIFCVFEGFPFDEFPVEHNMMPLIRILPQDFEAMRQSEDLKSTVGLSYRQDGESDLVEINVQANVVRTWEGKKYISYGQEHIRIQFKKSGEDFDRGFVASAGELIEARIGDHNFGKWPPN